MSEKVIPNGHFKANTTEIEINGKKVRVFTQEVEQIKKGLLKLGVNKKAK